ncbi:MAG: serine hydrolase [Bacteroidia bacterium]|nr:serine hydrolase [Bacteroidia bacterium]
MKNSNEINTKVSMLKKQIPAYWIALIFLMASSIILFIFNINHKQTAPGAQDEVRLSDIHYIRLGGFQYARPLLLTNLQEEDASYSNLKTSLTKYIESQKQLGNLQSASVYFKKLDSPSWFGINTNEEYATASLFKVPVMIALLMEADKDPEFLNRKLQYVSTAGFNENVTPLEEGKYYTLREVIHSMVSRSDNIAYNVCWRNMPIENFNKLLKDFSFRPFNIQDKHEYTVTVSDYSKFFRALYNAGYLSDSMSDLALKILAESDFNRGLVKDLKDNFPVARKFGLRLKGDIKQLHEFGVFYYQKEPYMLGVMTKGAVELNLYSVLSEISDIVYSDVKQHATAGSSVAIAKY